MPLIVRWPGQVPAGAVPSEIVSSIDFYPTLLEVLKIPQKENMQFDGISLAAVLNDPSARLDREAMFNFFPHGGPSKPPGVTVRQGNWKLIRWFETGPDYPSLHELYDLESDLGETTNLAQQHPERVKELDALIDRFLKDTGAAVPRPNPRFKIDPVQGWIPKSCDAIVAGDVLRVTGAGRRPFQATTRVQGTGPLELRVRLRSAAGGEVLAQWRRSDQETFPASGQTAATMLQGGDWQDARLRLHEKGELAHLRLYLPAQETPVEVDWIELWRIGEPPTRLRQWDFPVPQHDAELRHRVLRSCSLPLCGSRRFRSTAIS